MLDYLQDIVICVLLTQYRSFIFNTSYRQNIGISTALHHTVVISFNVQMFIFTIELNVKFPIFMHFVRIHTAVHITVC